MAIAGNGTCCNAGETHTSPVLRWPLSPEVVRLQANQIHLWCAALSQFASELPRFWAMLSPAERTRAERFRFPKDRDGYVIRHGILRLILSRYLEQLPSEIEFCHGASGKPEIKGDCARAPIYFNASHSGEIALYAITSACPVGVDVECTRTIPDIEEIASRIFSPRETQTLMALPTDSRLEGFYACWTRKEAFLKATGEGIGENLAKVEVTLAPGEEPKVLHITGDSQIQMQWQLRSFSPAPGYLAAVAFRHRDLALSQWRFPAPIA
jgi:4'-phosphopantetheinyl transferase